MFGRLFGRAPAPVIRCGDLLLRMPEWSDYEVWRDVRLTSHEFLKPFEPRWSDADLSKSAFAARLRRAKREVASGSEYGFFIFDGQSDAVHLLGGLTLSNIRRRAAQHVLLGYWMGVESAGKGIMTRAVGAVLPFAFSELRLHRIHAACLPNNVASRRVLEHNGFQEEGFAERYLQIDGAWRDHVLFGLTREQFETNRNG